MDESDVKRAFIRSGIIDGEWEEEVVVGARPFREAVEEDKLSIQAARYRENWCPRIDLVCRTGDGTWLVEVKGALLKEDLRALGQILFYERAYRSDHPDPDELPIRKALVFGPTDDGVWDVLDQPELDPRDHRLQLLEGVCIRNGIELWIQGRDF